MNTSHTPFILLLAFLLVSSTYSQSDSYYRLQLNQINPNLITN